MEPFQFPVEYKGLSDDKFCSTSDPDLGIIEKPLNLASLLSLDYPFEMAVLLIATTNTESHRPWTKGLNISLKWNIYNTIY